MNAVIVTDTPGGWADPLILFAVLVAILTVAAIFEIRDHRRRPPRHAAGADRPRLVVDEHPDGDIVIGLPQDIREYLLDAAREEDRGEPLPANVIAFARSRGGAR